MDGTVEKNAVLNLIIKNGIPCKYSVRCETNHDSIVLSEQIPQAAELACDLMLGLRDIAYTWRDDHRGSARACAKKAESSLLDSIFCVLGYLSDESIKEIREACDERDA